jgi:hypothetical protein
VFYVIFVFSVEDLNRIRLAVKIPESTKIDILIWREGHQFIGAMEAGRPLALGKTIAELNLDGKATELRTTSGRPLALGKTIAELNLDGKAIELRTTSGPSPSPSKSVPPPMSPQVQSLLTKP